MGLDTKKDLEETIARIMALPEQAQVEELKRILNALPQRGRDLIVAYLQMTKEEQERSAMTQRSS